MSTPQFSPEVLALMPPPPNLPPPPSNYGERLILPADLTSLKPLAPMAPPVLDQLLPQEAMIAPPQGGIKALFSRMSARYDKFVDSTLEKNPDMEAARLNMTVGVLGGLAVVGSVLVGPEVAEHVVAAVSGENPSALDIAAFSVTAGAAFAGGMNYHLTRRNTRDQRAK